ncbi:MAG: SPOR domain-containing protein [Candidatus Omnitrophota bacterium]
MVENTNQSDFFEGDFFEQKSRKHRIPARYPEQRFLPYLKIPVEYTVIIAIGVLVVAILSYALGVERGKKLPGLVMGETQANLSLGYVTESKLFEIEEEPGLEAERSVKDASPEYDEFTIPDVEPVDVVRRPVEAEEFKPRIPEDTTGASSDGSGYIVQLASLKNADSAVSETDKLKKDGIHAEYVKKGNWYQVYASGYKTIDQAKQAQSRLAKIYADCYIKKLD